MRTFKQYLVESERYTPITHDLHELLEFIKKHCSDAMWMLKKDEPFWRGGRFLNIASVVDPTLSERKSKNITNHYTVLLDNSPYMTDFPKRSRSLIASTSYAYSRNFNTGSMAIIPFDNVPIGIVGKDDIWNVTIYIFGQAMTFRTFIDRMDILFVYSAHDSKLSDFEKFDALLKSRDDAAVTSFKEVFRHGTEKEMDNFLDEIMKALGPHRTGFTVKTTKNYHHPAVDDTEVWIGGKCVAIPLSMWGDFLDWAKENDHI